MRRLYKIFYYCFPSKYSHDLNFKWIDNVQRFYSNFQWIWNLGNKFSTEYWIEWYNLNNGNSKYFCLKKVVSSRMQANIKRKRNWMNKFAGEAFRKKKASKRSRNFMDFEVNRLKAEEKYPNRCNGFHFLS